MFSQTGRPNLWFEGLPGHRLPWSRGNGLCVTPCLRPSTVGRPFDRGCRSLRPYGVFLRGGGSSLPSLGVRLGPVVDPVPHSDRGCVCRASRWVSFHGRVLSVRYRRGDRTRDLVSRPLYHPQLPDSYVGPGHFGRAGGWRSFGSTSGSISSLAGEVSRDLLCPLNFGTIGTADDTLVVPVNCFLLNQKTKIETKGRHGRLRVGWGRLWRGSSSSEQDTRTPRVTSPRLRGSPVYTSWGVHRLFRVVGPP